VAQAINEERAATGRAPIMGFSIPKIAHIDADFSSPARIDQSEIRVYLSNPNGTLFGYMKDKANCGQARLAARRLRITAPFSSRRYQGDLQ
jgi:hypothetical protein